MKKTIVLLFALFTIKGISQVYVSPNTNVYVKNQVVFVSQNINLAPNSNFYLRNNSQLLQGTTGTSTNMGTGLLSVYQEGTSDNFDYNYWCSPVGIASASAGNENFGVTLLNQPVTATVSNPATILLTTNLDGIANPLSIASRWIYKLMNANNYSQWTFVGNASTIAPGEGFTMKGTSGTDTTDPEGTGIVNNPGGTGAQRYDFRGKPNDGNISVTLGANNATLTGNPYPSALHLNAFLLDPANNTSTGVAYFWEQDKTMNSHYLTDYKGGYGTYSPIELSSNGVYVAATFSSYKADGSLNTIGTTSGLSIQRKYAPIGQGFLIEGSVNGTVTFRNAHREYYREGSGFSQFEKTVAAVKKESITEVSHFKLNAIINNQFTRQIALAFTPQATDGIDFGIDALNMDEALPNDAYFLIEDHNYVIQGINFEKTKKVALAVKATSNSTIKFYIPEVINFDSSQNIYLYDALDASYHDIKNGSYLVTVSAGLYKDRFKITFTNETLGTNENSKNQFVIFQDNLTHNLKASNPDNKSIKSFTLYDMAGKTILSKKDLGISLNYTFSTNGFSHGIYIAEFITKDNEKLIQKVFISNPGK